jgi:hypothetical protein
METVSVTAACGEVDIAAKATAGIHQRWGLTFAFLLWMLLPQALDDALVQRVLQHLQHPRDLLAAACVCRQWQRASAAPALWVQKLGRDADNMHMPTLVACQGSLQRYAVTRWVWKHGKGYGQPQEAGTHSTPILIQVRLSLCPKKQHFPVATWLFTAQSKPAN